MAKRKRAENNQADADRKMLSLKESVIEKSERLSERFRQVLAEEGFEDVQVSGFRIMASATTDQPLPKGCFERTNPRTGKQEIVCTLV